MEAILFWRNLVNSNLQSNLLQCQSYLYKPYTIQIQISGYFTVTNLPWTISQTVYDLTIQIW